MVAHVENQVMFDAIGMKEIKNGIDVGIVHEII